MTHDAHDAPAPAAAADAADDDDAIDAIDATDAGRGNPPGTRWPGPFLDALRADVRVLGAAGLTGLGCTRGGCLPKTVRSLLVVTTWDGRDPVAADLPRLGALALGAAPLVSRTDGARWSGLATDQRRVEIEVVRIGDLKPSARGEGAVVVHDTKALVEQWVRWSAGRDRDREDRDTQQPGPMAHDRTELRASRSSHSEATRPGPIARSRTELRAPRSSHGEPTQADPSARLLSIDATIRGFEDLGPSAVALGRGARPVPIRPRLAAALRGLRETLTGPGPAEAALAARIDAALRSCPQAGAGLRIVPGTEPAPDALEDFLRIADAEGFLGDRVLFAEASKRLSELARRPPVFDEGFVLPTFDAVEARWRIGEGIGGCRTPLVPGVYVGVGVTPADHLECWAAPFVREPECSVACVADPGTRVVRDRTAGKDALFDALLGEVERAWDELPDLLRTARRAGRTPCGDLDATWRPLHLPRSYREAATRVAGGSPSPSWLHAALALARAGHSEEPLNARKLGLAAGRLLTMTPAGAENGCDAGCDA